MRGTAVRLPTICVRTGLPNKAASTWASSVVREPLTGVDVVCPVTPQTVMVVLSPRKTVDAFMSLHDLPPDAFGPGRTLLLNGIKVTAKDLEQAVGRHAGNRKVGKVTWQHDPAIQSDLRRLAAGHQLRPRSRKLGFEIDNDLDEVVRNFIADDLDEQMKIAKAYEALGREPSAADQALEPLADMAPAASRHAVSASCASGAARCRARRSSRPRR